MRIVFVRHGEPDYANDTLTGTGLRQAELAAERLKEEGIREIWSSPLGRARLTADYASKALGLPVKTLDFMRELSWGSVDGEPIFANGHPWNIVDEMRRFYDIIVIKSPEDLPKIDVLMMVYPQKLSSEMVNEIKRYSQHGGKRWCCWILPRKRSAFFLHEMLNSRLLT